MRVLLDLVIAVSNGAWPALIIYRDELPPGVSALGHVRPRTGQRKPPRYPGAGRGPRSRAPVSFTGAPPPRPTGRWRGLRGVGSGRAVGGAGTRRGVTRGAARAA